MPGAWLFEASWWNVTVWNGSCKFAFLTVEAVLWMPRAAIVIWLAETVHWHRVMSSLIIVKVCRDFNVCILI